MPKVARHSIRFQNNERKEFDVNYSTKNGFTYKDFPEHMITYVQQNDGDTNWRKAEINTSESNLQHFYQRMVDRYYELTQTERRVILIKLAFSNDIYMRRWEDENGFKGWSGYQPWAEPIGRLLQDSKSGSLDYCIGFEFETGIVVTTKEQRFTQTEQDDKGEIVKRSSDSNRFYEKDYIVMDYDLDLELFLKSVTVQMKKLAERMASFLTNKERLLLAAKTREKLLTNG